MLLKRRFLPASLAEMTVASNTSGSFSAASSENGQLYTANASIFTTDIIRCSTVKAVLPTSLSDHSKRMTPCHRHRPLWSLMRIALQIWNCVYQSISDDWRRWPNNLIDNNSYDHRFDNITVYTAYYSLSYRELTVNQGSDSRLCNSWSLIQTQESSMQSYSLFVILSSMLNPAIHFSVGYNLNTRFEATLPPGS